jgi:hypothetical protein
VDAITDYHDLLPLVSLQPPVHLPSADHLTAVLRETPLVHTLLQLVEWTGGPRPALGEEDVREAVVKLGLAGPDEFARLWRVAANSELVVEHDATVATGPAAGSLTGGTGAEALEVWADILYALFSPEADPTALDPCTATLLLLLSTRDAMHAADIPELTEDVADQLVRLRLIDRSGPYVTLTPLGSWAALDLFKALVGEDIPVLGCTAGADAATLLRVLRSYSDEERAEEVAVWLEGRDPGQAARQIADILPEVSPLSRAVGLTVLLEQLGRPGREVAEELRETPRIGALILAREEDTEIQPTPEDVAWVYVDMTVAAMEIGGPPEGILALSGNLNAQELLGMLDMMGYSDHPCTEPVLRFLIEHHPERQAVSAARAALRHWQGHEEPPGARGRRPKKPRKAGKSAGSRKKRRR